MYLITFILLTGFCIKESFGDLVNVETILDPGLVNQNQVFINRKERFIKFDTKDNELEIELGISVPFIKVPLATSRDIHSGEVDSRITVNAPGVIVAGMLMLTSFIIIPFLFTTSTEHSFAFQRKEKSDVWSVVDDMNEVLYKNGINSSSCMQKSICWIAKTSKDGKDGSIGNWINYFLKTWWMKRLIGGTSVGEAVQTATEEDSCGSKFSECPLTNRHLQSFVKMVASGHS